MKLKNWWGISALILTTIGAAVPITLTTSCAEKKEWTFNNYNEVDNYLQKHKQDVSDAYIFSSTPNQTDYDFLKKNVNLQFFINGFLFTTSNYLYIASTETSAKKIELHIKNKTSTEIDLHQNSAIEKTTITYDDFLLTLTSEEEGESKTEEYNFKIDVTNNHYYTLVFTSYTIGRDLAFYTPGVESIPLLLSPYDWTNHFLFGLTNQATPTEIQ